MYVVTFVKHYIQVRYQNLIFFFFYFESDIFIPKGDVEFKHEHF